MNGKISYLLDILGFKEFVMLCGAGISKNSGLPLANEVKQYILKKLSVDKKDIGEIMASNLPFEAFMETLSENTDISKILEMFQNGKPNTNHILIARLAKKGYLKTIFTTNFDLLIEKALEKEGLKKNKDFKVYYDEEQFSGMDFKDKEDEVIRILKIHGSVDNIDSIRTTMKAVARKTLSDKRMKVIRYLFSTGKHKKVLILGYSCSNEFDITPQIQSVGENQKEIIFVEHCKGGKEIEDVRIKEWKNPFKTFPGKRIKCNTDDFIRDLWGSLKESVGGYEPIHFKADWKTFIDDWDRELKHEDIKHFIVGLTLRKISNFERAIEYFEKTLEISKAIGDKGEGACYTNLGAAYAALGDFRAAIKDHEKALEIAKAIGDKAGKARCYTNLGVAYGALGDIKGAIEYHEKALEIAKAIGDKAEESICYTDLGIRYRRSGDFGRAIKYYEKSLEIKETIGDKGGEAACYTNLGVAYDDLQDHQRAIGYFEKSLEITKAIGDMAMDGRCYAHLGAVYGRLGDLKRAIEYFKRSLEIAKTVGDKGGESICYTNLGIAYCILGNFVRAIEYSLNADKIFNETGQIDDIGAVYRNLSLAYEKIGDRENARDYKRKLSSIKIL